MGKFPDREQVDDFIRRIIQELKSVSESKSLHSKYMTQLLVLSGLRKFRKRTKKIIKDMPITIDFDIKEDVFYKEGLAEGREEGEAKSYFKIICNGMDLDLEISILMQLTGFSEEKILKIMGGVQKRDVAFLTKLIPLPKEDVREVLNDWEARQNKK